MKPQNFEELEKKKRDTILAKERVQKEQLAKQKKINVAILIAYLKLIRTKRHINVLFLDEVFSSIDLEGISDILLLLKSFSNEYNINIFVVHHALLNHENFDRIIRINKEIFSSIEEVNFDTLVDG